MKYKQIGHLLISITLTTTLSNCLIAQEKASPKEVFAEAESYFLFEEYTEALPLYMKLKEEFTDNFNLDYRIGRCYLNMPFEKQKSIAYLENAVKDMAPFRKDASLQESQAPLDAMFYLGDAYRINNHLEKAVQTYQQFKQQTNDKFYDFALVDNEIKACERALDMEKRPIEVKYINLGKTINTRFSETNPVISQDETMLVYAVKLPFYQAMFYSNKTDGQWGAPVNMIPELGADGDCYPTSISSDGTELFVYRSNEYLGDLFVTNFKNGKWTKLRKLNGNINTRYWESHACISYDGLTLYFTSNKKGGYGRLDIYKSVRPSKTSENWGEPVNLGPVINSPYNEETPFLTANGKRLYFSSFGHETMGGYDIFYSNLNPDGSWAKPVNIGYPINTTDDEIFFNPVKDGAIAYMSKYDPNGYGRFDILKYEIASDKKNETTLINRDAGIRLANTGKKKFMAWQPANLWGNVWPVYIFK
jgi:hypothetical protein